MSTKKRQLIGILFVLLIVAGATSWAFRLTHSGWVLYREAQSQARSGNLPLAIETLSSAINAGWYSKEGVDQLGQWLLRENRLSEAAEIFTKLHRKYPDDLAAVKVLAGLHDARGEVDQAILLYTDPAIAPKMDGSARLHLAELLRQAKRYREAAGQYELVIREEPAQKKARLHLAEMLAWQKDYNQAEMLLQSLLRDYPDDRQALLALARLQSWKGDFNASIETYRRIVH